MDILSSLLSTLSEKIFWWWRSSSSTPENISTEDQNQTPPSESSNKHDIPATKPPQTLVSEVQEGSSPAQSTVQTLNSHSVHPQNYQNLDEIATLDKINIYVKYAGKIIEVDMFPLERISSLLKEACENARKKPEKMYLVFDGEQLDVNKTVHECGLRGGKTVNLLTRA